MADNRTEKATPRRRDKVRKEGKIPRSREVSSAFALLAVLCLMYWSKPGWVGEFRQLMDRVLHVAMSSDINVSSSVLTWTGITMFKWTAPACALGLGMAIMLQLAQGGFVFAPAAIQPKFGKLNPANNVKQLFTLTGFTRLAKTLGPLSVITWLTIAIMTGAWPSIVHASVAGLSSLPSLLIARVWEISWKSAFVFAAWSAVDYALTRRKFENDLKMSKQDIREESKETEGNPQAKGRQRRLQRQMRKKRMLKDVEKATVIITNPTHFAVALRYDLDTMGAPMVVAKGRDLVAQQIRQIALWHEVPLVENPPLARALYRSVDVGSVIPAKLYTAVAEILAFVYRAQAQTAPRNGGKA
jgi:flagellar biosynthetic protein FlhB